MASDAQGSAAARGGIVITGASTGIGRECALYFDRLGYRVFAGVRKASDGEALAKAASPRLSPVIIDVTDARTITEAAAQVEQALGDVPLVGLVNNAGIGIGGPVEFLQPSELRRQMEVNLIGPVAVTQAFMPMLRRSRGRIVVHLVDWRQGGYSLAGTVLRFEVRARGTVRFDARRAEAFWNQRFDCRARRRQDRDGR